MVNSLLKMWIDKSIWISLKRAEATINYSSSTNVSIKVKAIKDTHSKAVDWNRSIFSSCSSNKVVTIWNTFTSNGCTNRYNELTFFPELGTLKLFFLKKIVHLKTEKYRFKFGDFLIKISTTHFRHRSWFFYRLDRPVDQF